MAGYRAIEWLRAYYALCPSLNLPCVYVCRTCGALVFDEILGSNDALLAHVEWHENLRVSITVSGAFGLSSEHASKL